MTDRYDIMIERKRFLKQQETALETERRNAEHLNGVRAIQRRHKWQRIKTAIQQLGFEAEMYPPGSKHPKHLKAQIVGLKEDLANLETEMQANGQST